MYQPNRSEAYDFSRFETKPQPVPGSDTQNDKILEMPKEQVQKNSKFRKRLRALRVMLTCTGLAIMFGISSFLVFGQVQLTELTDSITTANNALKESQSIQTQLQMNLDSQTSLAKIESVAADTLGMKRVVQSQMNYIGISQGDKGQVITEINQNWLVSAWNSLVNLLS